MHLNEPMPDGSSFFDWYPFPALRTENGLIRDMNQPALTLFGRQLLGQSAASLLGRDELPPAEGPGFTGLPNIRLGNSDFRVSMLNDSGSAMVLMSPADSAESGPTVRFMINIDQELRQQLAIISYSLRALTETVLRLPDKTPRKNWGRLEQSYYRLLRMSNNLRDAARFMRGEEIASFEDLDIAALCRRVTDITKNAVRELSITLTVKLPGTPVPVCGDEALLERLLYNLLTNAVRHSDRDSEVQLTLLESGERVLLTVSDNGGGSGIRTEDMYSYYEQERDLEDQGECGLALGIPLSKYIAEVHGGVLLMNLSGTGLSVTVSLPKSSGGTVKLRDVIADYAGEFRHELVELSVLPLDPEMFLTIRGKTL